MVKNGIVSISCYSIYCPYCSAVFINSIGSCDMANNDSGDASDVSKNGVVTCQASDCGKKYNIPKYIYKGGDNIPLNCRDDIDVSYN